MTLALASLAFSNDTTNHILAELRVAGVLTDDSIATVEALQADAQSRTQRAMIAPLLAGLVDADAAVLAGTISKFLIEGRVLSGDLESLKSLLF